METAAASPENVLPLTDTIMREGASAAADLERKRNILFRAFEVTARQLERDAEEMEKRFILGEMPMQDRYKMMHTAEALRVSASWITNALLPQPPPANAS
jgi:hypothetical protein